MFHAYRYRLENSGSIERGRFAIQISLWHRSSTEKPNNISKRAYCRTESSRNDVLLTVSCFIPVSVSVSVYLFAIRSTRERKKEKSLITMYSCRLSWPGSPNAASTEDEQIILISFHKIDRA